MIKMELSLILKNAVLAYDKILFLICYESDIINLLNSYAKIQLKKKILLISMNAVNTSINGIEYVQLNEKNRAVLYRLYHTYEFSNKFTMFSADNNFGTIWNYVRTGILTSEEVLSAVLD